MFLPFARTRPPAYADWRDLIWRRFARVAPMSDPVGVDPRTAAAALGDRSHGDDLGPLQVPRACPSDMEGQADEAVGSADGAGPHSPAIFPLSELDERGSRYLKGVGSPNRMPTRPVTAFFVPSAPRGEAELIYARLAASCGCPVPLSHERIREIHWTHDSDEWVATVGQKLYGRRVRVRRRGGDFVEVSSPLHDPATVRAIFPGAAYMVVTDSRPMGPFVSYWNNPFMAGQPSVILKFAPRGLRDG